MRQSIHAKRMERSHKRAKHQTKLNLVSLMDIFTILVFFLLVNSDDVEVLQSSKDITLPASVAEKKPTNNLVIMVSKTDILVGNKKIDNVETVLNSSDSNIALLKKELDYQASRQPLTTTEDAEKGRDITIMGDQTIPYQLLKKIMTTCADTDYRNISLAVNQIMEGDTSAQSSGG